MATITTARTTVSLLNDKIETLKKQVKDLYENKIAPLKRKLEEVEKEFQRQTQQKMEKKQYLEKKLECAKFLSFLLDLIEHPEERFLIVGTVDGAMFWFMWKEVFNITSIGNEDRSMWKICDVTIQGSHTRDSYAQVWEIDSESLVLKNIETEEEDVRLNFEMDHLQCTDEFPYASIFHSNLCDILEENALFEQGGFHGNGIVSFPSGLLSFQKSNSLERKNLLKKKIELAISGLKVEG